MEFCDRFHFSSSEEEEGEVVLLNLLFDAILITVELIRRRKIPRTGGTLRLYHVGKEFDVAER